MQTNTPKNIMTEIFSSYNLKNTETTYVLLKELNEMEVSHDNVNLMKKNLIFLEKEMGKEDYFKTYQLIFNDLLIKEGAINLMLDLVNKDFCLTGEVTNFNLLGLEEGFEKKENLLKAVDKIFAMNNINKFSESYVKVSFNKEIFNKVMDGRILKIDQRIENLEKAYESTKAEALKKYPNEIGLFEKLDKNYNEKMENLEKNKNKFIDNKVYDLDISLDRF